MTEDSTNTTIALLSDITPNRATVERIYASSEDALEDVDNVGDNHAFAYVADDAKEDDRVHLALVTVIGDLGLELA